MSHKQDDSQIRAPGLRIKMNNDAYTMTKAVSEIVVEAIATVRGDSI